MQSNIDTYLFWFLLAGQDFFTVIESMLLFNKEPKIRLPVLVQDDSAVEQEERFHVFPEGQFTVCQQKCIPSDATNYRYFRGL